MERKASATLREVLKAQFAFLFPCLFGSLDQSAWAGTTTLTFDEFSSGTVLTNQYESEGVTISGAIALATSAFPPVSGTNIAYAPTGLMTFTFNPIVIGGQVQTVSVYVSDNVGSAGIYAYDSSNNLLGESVLPATGGVNTLLSVTTSGAPIAYVTIHDAGSQFGVDNFTFTWTVTCSGSVEELQSIVAALPVSDFRNPHTAPETKRLITRDYPARISRGSEESAILDFC